MRIGQHRPHRRPISEWREVTRFRKGSPRSNDAGKRVDRDIENREQFLVPSCANDIEKLRARSVAGFDHRFAAEARQEKGVNCPDADVASLRAGLTPRKSVKEPVRLGGGEHWIERQATPAADR